MSKDVNDVQMPDRNKFGECELVGNGFPLLEPGIYQALYSHCETSTRFSKKTEKKDVREGGKLYLWFEIDPYGAAGLSSAEQRLVFLPYNAKEIKKPFGKEGNFVMGRRSKFFKDYQCLFGEPGKSLTLNDYKNHLFLVRIDTVVRNEKKERHPHEAQYSVIVEILRKGDKTCKSLSPSSFSEEQDYCLHTNNDIAPKVVNTLHKVNDRNKGQKPKERKSGLRNQSLLMDLTDRSWVD